MITIQQKYKLRITIENFDWADQQSTLYVSLSVQSTLIHNFFTAIRSYGIDYAGVKLSGQSYNLLTTI